MWLIPYCSGDFDGGVCLILCGKSYEQKNILRRLEGVSGLLRGGLIRNSNEQPSLAELNALLERLEIQCNQVQFTHLNFRGIPNEALETWSVNREQGFRWIAD